MYLIFKNIHVTSVSISILMYMFRFILFYSRNEIKKTPKWLKVLPHINDTVLLSSGVALISITGFIPFTSAAPWLTLKLPAVLGYIICGFYALSPKRTLIVRWCFFSISVLLLIAIVYLAMCKPMLF